MTGKDYCALLDLPAFPASGYALLADDLRKLLGTQNDVLLIQGEAVVALEAVATSIARPKLKALNIVTSPYGTWFGEWLRRGKMDVIDLIAEPGKPISVHDVSNALEKSDEPFDLLAMVHAESASGILNPLADICALAYKRGIITIVDAVASIGGHPINVDDNHIDIAVIGPQKALAGPAGISAISVSKKAWQCIDHRDAPANSILSLMDQKTLWIDQGRGPLPGTPSPLEFFALQAALERINDEGVDNTIKRHRAIAQATRSGLTAGGLLLWVNDDQASHLVTTVELPQSVTRAAFLDALAKVDGHTIAEAVGPGTEQLIRINHTGQNANVNQVEINMRAIDHASHGVNLPFNLNEALAAASREYET